MQRDMMGFHHPHDVLAAASYPFSEDLVCGFKCVEHKPKPKPKQPYLNDHVTLCEMQMRRGRGAIIGWKEND